MKPLTIEELKALEVGDWVWGVEIGKNNQGYVEKISSNDLDFNYSILAFRFSLKYLDYGKTWLAYKNKEQAECKGEKSIIPKYRLHQFVWAMYCENAVFRGQIEAYDYYTRQYLIFFDEQSLGNEWIPENLVFRTKSEAETQ